MYVCMYIYIYIYIYIRPIVKLRISKFGIRVKQILKQRGGLSECTVQRFAFAARSD